MDSALEVVLKSMFEAGFNRGKGRVCPPIVIDIAWRRYLAAHDQSAFDNIVLARRGEPLSAGPTEPEPHPGHPASP